MSQGMYTPHFGHAEMRATGHKVKNVPGKAEFENLKALCSNVLEPLRVAAGVPIRVNSGYRCPELNRLVGGAGDSQHLRGQAADITCGDKNANRLLAALAVQMRLPFDQLIVERGGEWLHVSHSTILRPRRQVLHL